MTSLDRLPDADLRTLLDRTRTEFAALRARGLVLDMTRGKPSTEQLDLSHAMLTLPGNGDWHTEAGEDARNYGGLQGLPEARALFAPILGAPPKGVVIGENSSLALMHDAVAWAMLKGVPGSVSPWVKANAVSFLCPVPGYDRHFAILDAFGIRASPVPLLGTGPDMDVVGAWRRGLRGDLHQHNASDGRPGSGGHRASPPAYRRSDGGADQERRAEKGRPARDGLHHGAGLLDLQCPVGAQLAHEVYPKPSDPRGTDAESGRTILVPYLPLGHRPPGGTRSGGRHSGLPGIYSCGTSRRPSKKERAASRCPLR